MVLNSNCIVCVSQYQFNPLSLLLIGWSEDIHQQVAAAILIHSLRDHCLFFGCPPTQFEHFWVEHAVQGQNFMGLLIPIEEVPIVLDLIGRTLAGVEEAHFKWHLALRGGCESLESD